ncbi:MAG: ABC transporter ATP-binding protein [Clostridia bacterium]|nr:ABC transporter ATP-binding protein [Clostridia bacterium]
MPVAYIELKNICKRFGDVQANDSMNLFINKGEIHALLGENGSGKSTLVNMLSGIYSPDSGQIFVNGEEVVFASPEEAIKRGIGMVHQHFKLAEVLTAKENIITGVKGSPFINHKKLTEQIYNIGKKYGLIINPDKKVYNMSVSEKQTVEILKVLYRGADVLILDEPTAVLTPQEIKNFFEILRNMKNEGCAIIIITHKLNEVMEISDKVTVLRKGKTINTVITKESNFQELTEMMVGRPISLAIERTQIPETDKKPLLEIKNLTVAGTDKLNALDKVSFALTTGEILGVAGIAGSGQKELCESIAGLCHASSGNILFKGEDIVGLNPRTIIRKGISMSFIPEDRLGMGLVGAMDIVDNMLLKSYQNKKGIFIDRKEGKDIAESIIEKFDINTPSVYHQVKKLSGGNIQKVLLGREINLQPQLLITAYPVRGLDIGASYNIYDALNEEKQKGVGILFIGEDLDVLLELSDRIMVLSHGKVMGIMNAADTNKEEIGMLMLGQDIAKGVAVC